MWENEVGVVLYLLLFALLILLYGRITYILQPTSYISSPLLQLFFCALLKSNFHSHVVAVALPLPDYFKNVSLLLVLNVCQIAPHVYGNFYNFIYMLLLSIHRTLHSR